MSAPEIADEEKRLALARVLQSRAFSRSDQLRNFLRYVCESELEGRAHQLNEYALGVSVLGRREGYSPAEDSIVRSRAYELRQTGVRAAKRSAASCSRSCSRRARRVRSP